MFLFDSYEHAPMLFFALVLHFALLISALGKLYERYKCFSYGMTLSEIQDPASRPYLFAGFVPHFIFFLISLFLYFFISLFLYFFISLFLYFFISLFLYFFISLFLYFFISLFLYFFITLLLYFFISLFLCYFFFSLEFLQRVSQSREVE